MTVSDRIGAVTNDKLMKNLRPLFLAAAAVLLINANLAAGDRKPLTSPRAKANEAKAAAGETRETLDRNFRYDAPRAQARDESLRQVAGTTRDSLDRNPKLTPKLRELMGPQAKEFQVAPLK